MFSALKKKREKNIFLKVKKKKKCLKIIVRDLSWEENPMCDIPSLVSPAPVGHQGLLVLGSGAGTVLKAFLRGSKTFISGFQGVVFLDMWSNGDLTTFWHCRGMPLP